MMDEQRKTPPKPDRYRWLWLLAMIFAGLLMTRIVVVSTRSQAIGQGKEMMADDFGFTVVSVQRLPKITTANEILTPMRQFLVVELQVANHAQRVDFKFDPRIVVVEEQSWQRYQLAESAQKVIDTFGTATNMLAAGETCRRKIVFNLPSDVSQPRIRIAFGGRIGEILDWLLYGNRWFEIPANAMPATNVRPN